MAVITKIRSYSVLLLVFVGLALIAFVIGDFFAYGPMRSPALYIGEVNDNKISVQDFELRVNEQLESWQTQTGTTNVGQFEAFQMRQQVWNNMVREILLTAEMEHLGVTVSSEELFYFIQGPNPHPIIVRNFMNPADGSFDPQMVMSFLSNLDQLDPATQEQWLAVERFIKRDRMEAKYHNLVRSGYFMPRALLEREFHDRNTTVNARVLFKPFDAIPDDEITVSDRELASYFRQNKSRFERDASANLQFVVFPIVASDDDRIALQQEIVELKEELATTGDISTFINANSDERFSPEYLPAGSLSPDLETALFNAPVGTIYGPFEENNAFVIAKVADVQFRPDSMNANHILIAHMGSAAGAATDRTLEAARTLADSLLSVVRQNPDAFGQLAVLLSNDPSAQANQGELGWFMANQMVPEFSEAVIQANVNSFTTAETQFGIHIIQVVGKSPATRKVQIARLTRIIEPSSRSIQEAFSQATQFVNALGNSENFETIAEEQGMAVRIADNIGKMDIALPGVPNPREIIRWAFDEATEVGSISEIFEIENRFIVAKVARKIEDGIPSLNDIRDEVMRSAKNEKKYNRIKEEFELAKQNGGFDQIASELQIEPIILSDLRFNAANLLNVGPEPRVIGAMFGMQPNTVSVPVKGNAGVFLVEVSSINQLPIPEDLTGLSLQLREIFTNKVFTDVFNALSESAKLEDNRAMFY